MPPSLNGQVIGQAENAIRAVLDRLLARTGTTFHEWVALNGTAAAGSAIDRDQLVARMAHGLKIDAPAVLAVVAGLTEAGLVETPAGDPDRLTLTAAGQARYGEIRTALDAITDRLYGDLPPDDLATAARVLAVVTDRANTELAGTR